jgi:hypothetical protein
MLGKDEDEAISSEELASVTELYITAILSAKISEPFMKSMRSSAKQL